MSIYNVYVKTSHGNMRVFEIAAISEAVARREAMDYGRVEFAVRMYAMEKK